ncbi:hypothetical protein CYY_007450 [Polysphondylium violaceum]|uniref:Monalysin Pore-forming domain-containing protein n=1 Tax=Polysphondylium violaceum TaxID=133409 RepID=A0A8J4UY08_9MYCE|nr:hypothetical protein CYY_007450 [Polysphondylium violaceum]
MFQKNDIRKGPLKCLSIELLQNVINDPNAELTSCLINNPIPYVKPITNPTMKKIQYVSNDLQIKEHCHQKNPPDNIMMIESYWQECEGLSRDFLFQIKPICLYLNYISSANSVTDEIEMSLQKHQGFSRRFSGSETIKRQLQSSLLGCDKTLEITSGFDYSVIGTESSETWKSKLEPGRYVIFQNIIVYCIKMSVGYDTEKRKRALQFILESASSIEWFSSDCSDFYFFVPLFKDDAFPKKYSESLTGPIQYFQVVEFITNDYFDKW